MSNQITVANVVSMTSREIAELTGKTNANVNRDIRNTIAVLKAGGMDYSDLNSQIKSTSYKDGNGIDRHQYELNKRMTLLLITGYSDTLRLRVLDRLDELERKAAAPKLPDFTNPAIAARAWADEVEQKLALAAQIEQQKPSVDFANRITNTKQTWSRRDAAKIIQYPPQAFNQWLKDNRHSNVNGAPSQIALNRGHQKVTCGEKNGHAYSNARITMKGLRYYATKIYSSEVPDDVLESLDNAQAQAEAQGE